MKTARPSDPPVGGGGTGADFDPQPTVRMAAASSEGKHCCVTGFHGRVLSGFRIFRLTLFIGSTPLAWQPESPFPGEPPLIKEAADHDFLLSRERSA